MSRPVVLIIRDGWGINPGGRAAAEANGDATLLARTPFHDHLYATYPQATLERERPGRGPAGRPDGQLRSRAPESRRRPHRLPGPHADQQSDRRWRARREPACSRRPSRRRKGARLHLLGLVSDGGVHSPPESSRRAGEDRARRGRRRHHGPRDHRWARHVADRRRGLPRVRRGADLRPTREDRHGHRPLLRHGSRQALGAQQARLGRHRARTRRAGRGRAVRRGRGPLRARRDDEFLQPIIFSHAQRAARARRRRGPLFQLPRRSRPPALPRVPLRRFRWLRSRGGAEGPLRHAHRVRRDLRRARSSSRRNRSATSLAKSSAPRG